MIIPPPTEQQLLYYIVQTHEADRIPITMGEVQNTLSIRRQQTSGTLNPFAQGHFEVYNYIFKTLLQSSDFPTKDSSLLTNEFNTEEALYWVKELHTLMMYPIATHAVSLGMSLDTSVIQTYQCGTYRMYPKTLAFSMAPEPDQVQPMLHAWIREIAVFHDQIKEKITNPYGLTRGEIEQLYKLSEESYFFISCLQPFEDGNNRLARIIENTLRMNWALPWKMFSASDHETFTRKMTHYQTEKFPLWFEKIKKEV